MYILRLQARRIALMMVLILLNQAFFPTVALALTSGPTQPEASSFTPASASDMVDLFTGDFKYNIPLLDVGGYPINISYSAGSGMDEEASWVGLGWNLNPGVINRQMRGVPDDFRGDTILKMFKIKPDSTTGINVGGLAEFKGLPLKLNASLGMYFNNYRGYGVNYGISPAITIGLFNKTGLTTGLGLRYDSQNGLDLSPSLGLIQGIGNITNKLVASTNINSRRGLRDMSISYNLKMEKKSEGNIKESNWELLGGDISFSGSTYTPTSDLPLSNQSFTFHGSGGVEFPALYTGFFLDGYRSVQALSRNRQLQATFGYMNSQLANPVDVMDFNRERNGLPWREYMPVLPPSFGTNDLFAASGQGASGQYRAIRSDIGYYKDAIHANESDSKSFGFELGTFPNLVKLGLDVNATSVFSTAKGWTEDNPLTKTAGYTDWDGKTTYEPVFFKNSGEMTMTDEPFLTTVGSTSPAQADMEKSTGAIRTAFQFSSNQKPTTKKAFNSSPSIKRSERERRNDVFQYLTGKEASRHGLEKQIISYKRAYSTSKQIRVSKDVVNCAIDETLSRNRFKTHHISEATIVKPDGSRYVYGIPAYNTYQKEVSFSVAENSNDNGSGLIQYATNDNSLFNNQGRDKFYSAEVLPAYPYAFLLTAVLSPDYIDRTGNGVTSDDYGSAVRINYSKNKSLFQWRTPVARDTITAPDKFARYQPGRKSDPKGKKASYIYGRKEVWYVHSIESATMVAQFYTTKRFDGLGVLNEDGTLNTDTTAALQKLDKIELYSKADLQKYGNAAVPIKTVNFVYNYELCPRVPNCNNPGGKGKLTLKRIYFTYGKSGRGAFNAYKFDYKNAPTGFSASKFFYNMTNVDRWGTYKVSPAGYPNTSEFPYAIQDETVNGTTGVNASIHDFAGAWALSQITLPSGGVITIDYESDDYAYVQNKRAGQMYFVKGFSRESAPTTIDNQLYTSTGLANQSRYVWVDLSLANLPANTIPDTNTFKARCLEDISNIYFNMDVTLFNPHKENITGYMEYDKSKPLQTSTLVSGNYTAVGIPIKIVNTDNGKPINPITKAALQTMRLELPALAYTGSEPGNGFEAVLKSFVGLAQSMVELFSSFETAKLLKGDGKLVGTTSGGFKTSWIRLNNARFKKFGGGHRVKQVTMNDKWDTMVSGRPSATYTQTYTYTTTQKVKVGNTEQNITISSGVASWEPTIGNEENSWKEPVTFTDKVKLAPSNAYYVEKPFGESLFPSPVVGYTEVKVQSLEYASNKRTGTGYTITKFYTSRDFPTIVDYSAPIRYKDTSRKLKKFFKIQIKDYLSLTQGFVVEVNDMHGKLKQEAMYGQNGALISSTTYEYKVDNANAAPLRLNNKVRVGTPNGNIASDKLLGVDVEVWQDFREESTLTEGVGMAFNTDGFWGFIIPIILFTGKSLLNKEDVRFRSAVTTKFVKRSGILAKVTKVQDGSTISTENLLWDSETGAVLATKTQNEFEDPIYQFTYPAHWVYNGMGMAYKNIGTRINGIYIINGIPCLDAAGTSQLANFNQMFTDGDEFIGRRYPSKWGFTNDSLRLTAYNAGMNLKLYNDKGAIFTSGAKRWDLYLTRSGRRNMAGTTVATLVSKTNPLNFSTIQAFSVNAANKITDASASLFSDLWQRDCDCQSVVTGDTINPYRHGMKGNWRLQSSFANHSTRTATKMLPTLGVSNIRVDGVIKNFLPFYTYGAFGWEYPNISDPSWIRQSTINAYDSKGNAIQEMDALGIYSAAYYGYQNNLNTAVAHNTRFRQAMFEGFEDYTFDVNPGCDLPNCNFNDHGKFDVKVSGTVAGAESDSIAHTGRYSFRVGGNVEQAMVLTLDTVANATVLQQINNRNNFGAGAAACLPAFKPSPGTYLISGWLYTGEPCGGVQSTPSINMIQAGTTTVLLPSGPVIEGWQRVFQKVSITASTGAFELRLKNPLNKPVYFDDIRVLPWLGNMKSFVYDPISLRLMAVLDENNYATFYEYDEEGMLIRVKRETERGIMTVEEHRSALKY